LLGVQDRTTGLKLARRRYTHPYPTISPLSKTWRLQWNVFLRPKPRR